jgi:3-deoxy-D-manno-octulosonic-acid transferase
VKTRAPERLTLRTLAIFVYNLLLIWAGLLVGPFLLLKKRTRYGLLAKLGAVPSALAKKYGAKDAQRPIWFHAVSVGEINAGLPLIMSLHKHHPQQPIIVSTTTGAGYQHAQERLAQVADCFYFPFDVPWSVNNYLTILKPRLVTIIETEIWPGFLHRCKQLNVPTAMVNARMSPRSFNSYNRWRAFFGPVLADFDVIGVQSSTEFNRYKRVGGENLNVQILGNIKFDGLTPISAAEIAKLRQQLRLVPADQVFVVGSTHEGEESIVLQAYRQLPAAGKTKLVIAPRHPERFDRVAEMIGAAGLRPRRFSRQEGFENEGDVLLLDSIGNLMKFYAVADVALVGGTLVPVGGHNLMEPYTYSVPVIAGPYIHKTKDVADTLQNGNAIVFVKDSQELERELFRLLNSKELRMQLGANGHNLLTQSQGAVDRAVTLLEGLVDMSSYSTEKGKPGEPICELEHRESVSGDVR